MNYTEQEIAEMQSRLLEFVDSKARPFLAGLASRARSTLAIPEGLAVNLTLDVGLGKSPAQMDCTPVQKEASND